MLASTVSDRKSVTHKYVMQRIYALKAGESLPSLREIMKACGVGQATVQEVIKELEQTGLVKSAPRRGVFKVREIDNELRHVGTIDVAYLENPEDRKDPINRFHGELMSEICTICGHIWTSVRMHVFSKHCSEAEFSAFASASECRACITVGLSRPEIAEILDRNKVASVHLFPSMQDTPTNSIITDAEDVIGQQFRHFYELGHRRIGYMHTVDPNHYHKHLAQRRECFYRLMAENGLKVSPKWVVFGGHDPEYSLNVAKSLLGGPQRPTALIAFDLHLTSIYHAARELGLEIGKDLSVVGTDDLQISQMLHPPATSLRIPRREGVKKALELLEDMLCGIVPDKPVILPTRLIERASSRKIS